MMSGAEDPVVFYLKIKTETTGVGHIVKHSEDGKVANIKFNIAGNGVNQTVTTKADGTVDIELMPGVYLMQCNSSFVILNPNGKDVLGYILQAVH